MKSLFSKLLITVCLSTIFTSSALASEAKTHLFRFADIHKNWVTFVYAGDIYVTKLDGKPATRLTSHIGKELFPKFSRDGKRIAFSAEFSGNRQVYVMQRDGSDLKQLTWYNDVGTMPPRGGFDYRVLDWSADDQHVIVRANRLPQGQRLGQPYRIPVNGGMPQALPIPESGGGMLSPDGNTFVYTPIDREWRTWKRYRGGRAQDVWTFDLNTNSAKRLTSHRATDHQPVWVGNDIFFVSDRDYTLNLYRYDPKGQPQKVTQHGSFDVLWPSAGPDAIVYENGGRLWRYEPKSQRSEALAITVASAGDNLTPQLTHVAANIDSVDISPDGNRALFAARGEIFSVPAKHGITRNLSRSEGVRETAATWSPDGRYVAYLSDASGEYEIYLRDRKNGNKVIQVTRDGSIWRFPPVWAPNSRYLAYGDKNQDLWYVDIEKQKSFKVSNSKQNDITDYTFSPDSRWLAYTKTSDNFFNAIWLYDIDKKTDRQLTGDTSNERNPSFDASGKYLYFLSDRDFNLSFSALEFNYQYENATRVYVGLLDSSATSPFRPKSDEVAMNGDASKSDKEEDNGEVNVEFENFENRVSVLGFNAGQYRNLKGGDNAVFVIKDGGGSSELLMTDLNKPDAVKTVFKSVNDYRLSHNNSKLLVSDKGSYSIVDAKPDQDFGSGKLDLSEMKVLIDPRREWQQMYRDAWRILRDWFYDPGVHGMDWKKVYQKYQPLIPHLSHRSDLDYILGEVAGELNAGHVYVNSGDEPRVQRVDGGLLGAEISPHRSGFFRIDKIFQGENWHDGLRSPLTEAGVKAKVGNFIVRVNGRPANEVNNFYELMVGTANKAIELELNDEPELKGAWTNIVKPVASETALRYQDWVASRQAIVDEKSKGRIGYIHLPNTAIEGNRELFKRMLPQMNKDALIIDDRYNGGGFIPDRMMELLGRKTLNYWKWRGVEPRPTPLFAHDGPKAMLVNGYSSSGGDALPYYFRKLQLGKIIGTRTWGGLIGISGNPGLVDGGGVLAATFRILDTDGKWVVENEGVMPDIEVIDRPDLVAKGQDPSLERALEELLKDLKPNPRSKIKTPPAPTKF